jgi:hypothetical protein
LRPRLHPSPVELGRAQHFGFYADQHHRVGWNQAAQRRIDGDGLGGAPFAPGENQERRRNKSGFSHQKSFFEKMYNESDKTARANKPLVASGISESTRGPRALGSA